jgi:hypothetical protein
VRVTARASHGGMADAVYCIHTSPFVSELLLTPRIQLGASLACLCFGSWEIWLRDSSVTRFLTFLGDRAVAPTTPGGPLGVHCTGGQSACRTASNINRVASRLGFCSPDRNMHNGHLRFAQKGTYYTHHTSLWPNPATAIPQALSWRRYIDFAMMSPPSRIKALCDHDNALPCLALQSSRGRRRAHFPSLARGVLIVPRSWWCAEAPLPASHCRSAAAVAAEASEIRRR